MDSSAMDISPSLHIHKKRNRNEEEDLSQPTETFRPAKRPAVGLEFPWPRCQGANVTTVQREKEIEMDAWRLSEDWVNKTSGLRLDSPLLTSLASEDGDIARFHLTDRGLTAHGSGRRQTLHEYTYLPTPKESPVTANPDTNRCEFDIKGSRLRDDLTSADGTAPLGHAPSAPGFNTTQVEDSVMHSLDMISVSSERKRIFMGYREGCESCRLRVPGHYIHYI